MKEYLASIAATAATGQATEHSYRAAVEALFHRLYPQLEITNEPRRQACGAPDFVVQRGGVPLGYIEAKDLGKDLGADEFKEQFGRYRRSLDNLLITDYLRWQLWQRGELVLDVRIGDYQKGQPVKPRPQDYPAFAELLQVFVTAQGQRIGSAETLAQLMADKARLLQYVLLQALTHPEATTSPSGLHTAAAGSLESQYAAFKQMLIHDLTEAQFADIYAQTIAYGLFAARLHDPTPDTFSRQEALGLVPASNPFLRKLFSYVAGTDLDERVVWIVDALAELFRAADVAALLAGFGQSTQMTDPFLYFYETFLGRYNPALKKSRGVYYTPQPVVRFIVRAVDEVLRRDFGLADGLADTARTTVEVTVPGKGGKLQQVKREVARVQVLDPATGTGTFLAEVVRHIHASLGTTPAFWSQYVEQHLIPRLHGFEIMMASYAMCHLKLGLLLQQLGYQSPQASPPRLSVYLTNALEEAHPDTHTLFASWLSDESNQANVIKRDAPVMVVLGNPPYSISSTNRGEWILNLIQDYKRGLNERKVNLDDDYIKFIRYAEHFIEKNGQGVVGFITNNSFLDGLTHRQMRKHLLETFDSIYVIDLHGNSKKKEKSPDGSKDENIFDIQQGVALHILVKNNKEKANELASLYYYSLYGSRNLKYKFLDQNKLTSIKWTKILPQSNNYFFYPINVENQTEYQTGIPLNELFPVYNSGVSTDRDPLFIDLDMPALSDRMKVLLSGEYSEDFKNEYRVHDSGSYKATEKLRDKSFSSEFLTNIQYRIFDERPIYYDREIISRPASKAFRHIFQKENIGIIFKRQANDDGTSYSYSFVTDKLVINGLFAIDPKGREVIAPLYLYPDAGDLYAGQAAGQRRPNLQPAAVQQFAQATGLRFVPEATAEAGTFAPLDVLDYVYGTLHQPAYRRRYHELLRIDFPRVPLPASAAHLREVVAYGRQLRELHLLRPAALPAPLPTRLGGDGTHTTVEKPRYDAATQRVYLSASQYVEPVAPEVWAFPIGGYQPAQKWLKDRQGRALTFDEVRHYQRLLAALAGTERLMRAWDAGHPMA